MAILPDNAGQPKGCNHLSIVGTPGPVLSTPCRHAEFLHVRGVQDWYGRASTTSQYRLHKTLCDTLPSHYEHVSSVTNFVSTHKAAKVSEARTWSTFTLQVLAAHGASRGCICCCRQVSSSVSPSHVACFGTCIRGGTWWLTDYWSIVGTLRDEYYQWILSHSDSPCYEYS